jgi:hypothetical protein
MVEVSRSGAVRSMISWRNVQQSTDRIARTIDNVVVCRTFLRSVLFPLSMLTEGYRPLPYVPSAERPPRNVAFCKSFTFGSSSAVDAVGIFSLS